MMGEFFTDLRQISVEVSKKSGPAERIFAFWSIPITLLIFGILPPGLHEHLRLQLDDPTVLSIFFSNFIHASINHLANNILSFLVVMLVLFPLAVLAEKTDTLFAVSIAFLILVPFIVSVYTIIALAGTAAETAVGFSGVVAAFAGSLSIFIGLFAKRAVSDKIQSSTLAAGLMGTELAIILLLAGLNGVSLWFLFLVSVGAIIFVGRSISTESTDVEFHHLALLFYSVIVFAGVPVFLIVKVSAGTNVYGHLAGLISGFVLPILPLQIAELSSNQ
ncbi:hypothetical protein [Haloarchaeobius sp. HRN-SO-5]|uniref:hypothetical protein n=1 Tax=Haloarchaeobius sp. HRN-SO-5 TaxID=3446118 RepID=UPI003EBF9062